MNYRILIVFRAQSKFILRVSKKIKKEHLPRKTNAKKKKKVRTSSPESSLIKHGALPVALLFLQVVKV